jgi:hypothetical protein
MTAVRGSIRSPHYNVRVQRGHAVLQGNVTEERQDFDLLRQRILWHFWVCGALVGLRRRRRCTGGIVVALAASSLHYRLGTMVLH